MKQDDNLVDAGGDAHGGDGVVTVGQEQIIQRDSGHAGKGVGDAGGQADGKHAAQQGKVQHIVAQGDAQVPALAKHVGNEERLAHIKALRGLNDTLSALKANYEFMGASWAGRYGYECTPKNIKIHYGSKQQTYTWEVIAKMVDKRINGADTEVFEQLSLFRI